MESMERAEKKIFFEGGMARGEKGYSWGGKVATQRQYRCVSARDPRLVKTRTESYLSTLTFDL